MAKQLKDKLASKRQQLVERTARALQIPGPEAENLLSIQRQQSLRINTLKENENVQAELHALGWGGEEFEWYAQGLTITAGLDALKASKLIEDGEVYIQNAASWLPVLALDPQPGEKILDICAAPGGKTSHIAALSDNKAFITANDNSRPRLARLRANMARLGVQNIDYALYDATQLTRKLDGTQFDKILLDAPCSGEGMMNIQVDKDFATWSVAHIKRLQQLQKRILVQAWQLLKPGGTLVYSTCTMAPEENEAVIDYLLRHNEDVNVSQLAIAAGLKNRSPAVMEWNDKHFDPRIMSAMRLTPSKEIEAFFVCKLQKPIQMNL